MLDLFLLLIISMRIIIIVKIVKLNFLIISEYNVNKFYAGILTYLNIIISTKKDIKKNICVKI